jgi:hypothetical protein
MNVNRNMHIVFSLATGGLLLIGLLLLLNGTSQVGRAVSDELFVKPGGTGTACTQSQPCTLHIALGQAIGGDVIYIAQGTYTSTGSAVITITKSITLYGGWDGAASTPVVRDPNAHPTILDGENGRRVVYISGDISPVIDGFTITGGNATNESNDTGRGGGIYSKDADPIIKNNVIVSNTASITPTAGGGGGIYLYGASASALISGNQVLSNTAYSTWWDLGGGGLCLSYSEATILGNLIQGNTCNHAGGGIHSHYSSLRILANEIRANVAGRNGGGIYLRDDYSSLIQVNLIVSNSAGGPWHSGGIYITSDDGTPTIAANRIFSNTANDGAGLGLATYGHFTVINNFFAHNNNGGIRLWDAPDGLVANNTIAFNTGSDGGIRLNEGYITPTIVNNVVVSNTYGISAHANASGTLDYNDVWGNTDQDYDLPGALEPGSHDIQADPLFVELAGNDYHLRAGSPCIDAATDAGVTTDIDGDSRPAGAGYDIGADEFRQRYIYLPVVVKDV